MTKVSQKLNGIQVGRAIAALFVVAGHTLKEALHAPETGPTLHWVHQFAHYGIGVDIFFVISGFIMAYISEGRIGVPGYARYFIQSRLMRVVPLYWFYTALLVTATLLVPQHLDNARFDVAHVFSSLFFYPWSPHEAGQQFPQPILALGWTLNYEMMFYIAFFVLLLVMPPKRLLPAMLILLISLSGLYLAFDWAGTPFVFWFRPIILEFAAGIVIFQVSRKGLGLTPVMAAALIGVSISGWLILPNLDHGLDSKDLRFLLLGLPASVLVLALALWSPKEAAQSTRLWKALVKIGDASYSLYLSHPFVITAVFLIWNKLNLFQTLGAISFIAATIGLSIMVGIIAQKTIEEPLLKATRRLIAKKARADVQTAPT